MEPKKLRKEAYMFKNPINPSCIDLFLTNTIRSLQETQLFETELSDFHKLLMVVLKSTFPKSTPQKITCRSYKLFKRLLRDDLNYLLSKENMTLEFTSLTNFTKIFIETLNKHALKKKKYIHVNHANFVTKGLGKTIMLRSRL